MVEAQKVSATFLDDLLSPEDLQAVKAKRDARAKHDLSDLIVERVRPAAVELLGVAQVVFFSQINTCLNCRETVEYPAGLVAMHRLKRHGRITNELIGVALSAPNQYPEHPRLREVTHTQTMVCSKCVDQARFLERLYSPPPIPIPGTAQWDEQFGYAATDDIRQREEAWQRRQEQISRELSEIEARIPPKQIIEIADDLRTGEEIEYTSPEDTQ